MTTAGFDDFSPEEWGPRSSRSRKTGSRAGMMGLGLAVVLSATFLASGHYSVPFVQYIGSYSDDAAQTAKSSQAPTAAPGTGPRIADARGGRVFSTPADETRHRAPAARDDRVVAHNASNDRPSLAYDANAASGAQPSPERFIAPVRMSGAAKLSEALAASRIGKRAELAASGQNEPGEAAMQSVASAIRADIAADMPHPSIRPEVQLASLTAAEDRSTPLAQRFAGPIPMPTARPQVPERAVRELASVALKAEEDASLAQSLNPRETSAGLSDGAPVPTARPAHRAAARAVAPVPSASTALAYAPSNGATDDGGGGLLGGLGKLFSGGGGHSHLPGAGSGVAVYEIKSATVYLPNGDRLEAHSGLGHMQDNPRYVDAKNKGPTPPNVYNLVMRESPFHGVQAIRLLPADGKKKFGRDGLLAHTYMYRNGDSSQSNGCVVFKDYKRFLHAFKKGKITRMVVVPDMSKLPTYMAAL